MTRATLACCAAMASLTLCVACERAAMANAREWLRSEGFTSIELTERRTGSRVDFTAKRGVLACHGHVLVLKTDRSTSVDSKSVCRPDEQGCHDGRVAVCMDLARMHDEGDDDPDSLVVPNRRKATALYQVACEHHHAPACRIVASRAR